MISKNIFILQPKTINTNVSKIDIKKKETISNTTNLFDKYFLSWLKLLIIEKKLN